ncbi:MAG: NAD(P)/FAD-dependent oxidoreductase [Desulfobulbaceae bacterium]
MNKQQHTTYVIMPGIEMGMLTPDELEHIAQVCRKYEVPAAKITGAQRLAFLGIEPERLAALKEELRIPDTPPHARNRIHYVQACPGRTWCRYGAGDSLALGRELEKIELSGPLPSKVKVGVSGCRFCCCESWVRDLGFIAERRGWKLIFGGNGAGRPRIGDVVAEGLSDQEAVALAEKCLTFYRENARFKTRSARFMERFGIDALKEGLFGKTD